MTGRTVTSAAELLQEIGVDIESVQFYKLSAEVDETVEHVDSDQISIEPSYNLLVRSEGDEIGVRLLTRLKLDIGTVEVDAAVNYRAAEPVEMEETVRLDFANNVGIMALLPFVRQAVADLTQRVFGETVIMPIIQRGELAFTVEDALGREDEEGTD